MNLSKESITKLDKIGATARFHMNPEGVVVCEIIDRTTNKAYASGTGLDRELAVEDAVTNAYNAPKPLTKAQEEGAAHAEKITASLQAENEKLKKELEAARAATQAATPRSSRKPALSPAE